MNCKCMSHATSNTITVQPSTINRLYDLIRKTSLVQNYVGPATAQTGIGNLLGKQQVKTKNKENNKVANTKSTIGLVLSS